jgi:hypothetical protein
VIDSARHANPAGAVTKTAATILVAAFLAQWQASATPLVDPARLA